MGALDLFIIFGYLLGISLFGVWFSRKQRTTRDYFLGGGNVPGGAIAAPIGATEASTVPVISVPRVAFARGGHFPFPPLLLGYMPGRAVISLVSLPSCFR